MSNEIYIVGAGAVGKALAVSLKIQGKNVTIIRGSVDDNTSQIKKISIFLNDGTELIQDVRTTTLSSFSELNGIIVLTNKSYGNKSLSQKLKGKVIDSPIVLLQNGLGVEQPFIESGFTEIYRCVLFMTSQDISENEISYKPVAVSPIGTIKSKKTDLNDVVDKIDSFNFKFKAKKNIQKTIWEKVIANCVFNSICPLLETDNGIFHRNPFVFEMAKRIVAECVLVSEKNGIPLDANVIEKKVLMISELSDGQFISTLQDIRKKRKTEIDTLNFEIVKIAENLNIGHLVQETRLLGELTKMKSELTL